MMIDVQRNYVKTGFTLFVSLNVCIDHSLNSLYNIYVKLCISVSVCLSNIYLNVNFLQIGYIFERKNLYILLHKPNLAYT